MTRAVEVHGTPAAVEPHLDAPGQLYLHVARATVQTTHVPSTRLQALANRLRWQSLL